ncbi:MAG: DNA polymerase III subunit chi [Gammaproteobacteria bacterium]|nr:DNA polymerase III subunit chi [Gammaproteobacteria bacterium]
MKNDVELANVSFYRLDRVDLDGKFKTACRLASQAYERSKSVFILTANEEDSQKMDQLLWDFPSNRFIPHVQRAEKPSHHNLVRIHHQLPEDSHYVLINLTDQAVAIAGKLERIFEITMPSEADSARARQNHYEQLNCTVQTHSIKI